MQNLRSKRWRVSEGISSSEDGSGSTPRLLGGPFDDALALRGLQSVVETRGLESCTRAAASAARSRGWPSGSELLSAFLRLAGGLSQKQRLASSMNLIILIQFPEGRVYMLISKSLLRRLETQEMSSLTAEPLPLGRHSRVLSTDI